MHKKKNIIYQIRKIIKVHCRNDKWNHDQWCSGFSTLSLNCCFSETTGTFMKFCLYWKNYFILRNSILEYDTVSFELINTWRISIGTFHVLNVISGWTKSTQLLHDRYKDLNKRNQKKATVSRSTRFASWSNNNLKNWIWFLRINHH